MLIENLKLFLLIIDKGGLAAAGREMGLSPTTVTDRLAALEKHYNACLLTRTTRSISLTDEGRDLMVGAKRILAEVEETETRIRLGIEKISGRIHISAPNDLGKNIIVPILDQFMYENPEISIELTLADGYVDIVSKGIDLALRYGELPDSSLKTLKIGLNQRIVCASPKYFKLNGIPKHPDDLKHHNCLLMRFGGITDQDWLFSIGNKDLTYRVSGNRIADDGDQIRQWCINGYGLALKSFWDIQVDLIEGRLMTALEEFSLKPNSLQMVYPAGAIQPRRVRALMVFLKTAFHNLEMKNL